jgi:tripartite-type tricarboxylate transporter receptor subunit TctC
MMRRRIASIATSTLPRHARSNQLRPTRTMRISTRPEFRRNRFRPAALCAGLLLASGANAQGYPVKPIRIITADAGAATDIVSRVIAQGLTTAWGQAAIVENRSGNVAIPAGIVARAPADGYTLLVFINALWLQPLLQDSTSYNVLRDFSPITLAASTPNIVVVHPSLPVKSVKELIALAKAMPGQLNYASGISGAMNHLAGALFNHMAGVNIVRVPYKGASPAVNALVGGEAHLMFATAASVMPHVKSSRVRALAVTSAGPSALAPGLPTVSSAGLPGYEAVSLVAMFAPTGTPQEILDRLHAGIVQILNQANIRERLFNIGLEIAASSPEQLTATVKAESSRMEKAIRSSNIRTE